MELFHWSSRDDCITALTDGAKQTKCSNGKMSESYVTKDWAGLSNIIHHNKDTELLQQDMLRYPTFHQAFSQYRVQFWGGGLFHCNISSMSAYYVTKDWNALYKISSQYNHGTIWRHIFKTPITKHVFIAPSAQLRGWSRKLTKCNIGKMSLSYVTKGWTALSNMKYHRSIKHEMWNNIGNIANIGKMNDFYVTNYSSALSARWNHTLCQT